MSASRSDIEELVYRTCLLLDEQDFEGYLALCTGDFRYGIRAYSPEIRRDMVWMDLDKPGLTTLFRNLPKHNSDRAPLSRHATVYTVATGAASGQASVVTALQVFRTDLDGGTTELFAVGKIHDTITLAEDRPLLRARAIRLDTRRLGIGTHIPF